MSDLMLSVVVSTYNQEKYIAECLQSIIDQHVDFDFEIVIANDSSTDNTADIIAKFLSKYPKLIRLLENETNLGAAKNYYRVHAAAKGRYVAHIDGDDVMLPGKLQRQVNVLEKNSKCNFVIHSAYYFNDDRSYMTPTGALGSGELTYFSVQQQARWPTLSVHSSYMYRNTARKTRSYRKDIMEWFYAMEYLLDSTEAVGAFINDELVMYRCNMNGQAYTGSVEGKNKTNRILLENLYSYFYSHEVLRCDIYSNILLSTASYFYTAKKVFWVNVMFLLKNMMYLRPSSLLDAVLVRKKMAPKKF